MKERKKENVERKKKDERRKANESKMTKKKP